MATHEYNPDEVRKRRIKGRRKRKLREWFVFTGYLTPSLLGVLLLKDLMYLAIRHKTL